MPESAYLWAASLTMFAVTFALRALPFAALKPLRGSALIMFLQRHLPAGIMVILAVYTQGGSDYEPHRYIVAKSPDGVYEPDKRVMRKIKHERTADCVVAGYRPHKSGPDAVGSLLLGLYRPDGGLASVGVVGAFPMEMRRALLVELEPLLTTFDEHPWNWAKEEAGTRTPRSSQYSRWNVGKDLSFIPLRPERVLEVRYDHMEGPRFRHTAQFVRWRPDRDPRSCTYEQLEEPVSFDLSALLGQNQVLPNGRG